MEGNLDYYDRCILRIHTISSLRALYPLILGTFAALVGGAVEPARDAAGSAGLAVP